VSARDVVWLENPFPHAEKWNPFPPKCAMLFGDYCKPTSRPCTETYLHMHYALQAHGVKPSDDLIWVGHSAGGQIGLTMAHLAKNHDKFPELAKKKAPAYHFDMVITL